MVYAQYRLGAELIGTMPPEIKRTIGRFRQLYDMGLHGPEVFGFAGQGQKFLRQRGDVFFDRVCRAVRMERSEGAMAYLYGLVAYYAISSVISPYIHQTAQSLSIPEGKIRTEFDRFLLETDGKSPAFCYDRSRHIHLTPGECETVATFYPGISAGSVEKSVKRMARILHQPVLPAGSRRNLVVKVMELHKEGDFVMGTRPDHRLISANQELFRLYQQARSHYPALLSEILIRLRKKVLFSSDFSLTLTYFAEER